MRTSELAVPNKPVFSSPDAIARETIESSLGRELSDEEWALYRSRLLAFLKVLHSWDAATCSSDDLGYG